jgi:ElaB/YqjD/DUF883 family membrane-anchored ribosome-binding protein
MAGESQTSSGAQGAQQQVQEKAQEAAGEARSRLRDQVDQRSTQAGEQVSSSAQALRSTAQQLRDEGQEAPARAAEQLARQAERVGGWLSESDADRILGDVEDFARRQPLAVVGIGLFAGFAASRFLKASSQSRYETRQAGTTQRDLPAPRSSVERPPGAVTEPPPVPVSSPYERAGAS